MRIKQVRLEGLQVQVEEEGRKNKRRGKEKGDLWMGTRKNCSFNVTQDAL